MAHESGVKVVAGGSATSIGSIPGVARVAISDGEGSVIVEEQGVGVFGQQTGVELYRLDRKGVTKFHTAQAVEKLLLDIKPVRGVPHLLYALYLDTEAEENRGDLILVNLATGESKAIVPAFAVVTYTQYGSIGGSVIVATSAVDLTERFSFYDLEGNEITNRPNPTADLPYGAPPDPSRAVLGADGKELAYLDGPAWNGLESRLGPGHHQPDRRRRTPPGHVGGA